MTAPQASVRRTASALAGRGVRVAAALALGLTLTGAGGGPAGAVRQAGGPVPGSTRSGDSLFPFAGNGGYDVRHYRVVLGYRPKHNRIEAVTTIRARAEHGLSSFSLDLSGLRVQTVYVDGRSADFTRHGHELIITPTTPVRGVFTASISYGGHPVRHTDPDGSSEGWIRTPDGATALGEPVGTMTWIPVDNTPRDKARYTFKVTAPVRLAVVANGLLTRRIRHERVVTWTWHERVPMASYLAMVSLGRYRVFRSSMRAVDGRQVPVWSFVQRSLPSQQRARRLLPRIIRFEERHFGAYPMRSVGIVAHKLDVGYALETQDRPVFPGRVPAIVLVHELAHQWYGDSVTLRDWMDIWLNEGFATYAEWLWRDAHGGPSPSTIFHRLYRKNGPKAKLWSPAPASFTDPADLFGAPVYERGSMTLQALRERVGSRDFFRILRTWAREHRHGGASTRQFIALSERISGQDLHKLFKDWLLTASRPTGY
ncbi:MAG TPA: M1 family metallopeptidase [Nocardioidaceae bacterium]|nr:M1 family metallopeptidase [Nocardioidaceae bacterium]